MDLKIVDWKEDKKGIQIIWEAIVGAVTEVFENQPQDQFATKVSPEGNLNDPDAGILPTIWKTFFRMRLKSKPITRLILVRTSNRKKIKRIKSNPTNID